jgi:hypothetical protein
MYGVGALVFASPAARLAALCYLAALHLLVFASLTHSSHRSSVQLMDHHDSALSAGRHDLTGLLHADGAG